MTNTEIWNIANELTEQEVGLLLCYKLSQMKKAELGWFCNSGDGTFYGICQWIHNEEVLNSDWEFTAFNKHLKKYVTEMYNKAE